MVSITNRRNGAISPFVAVLLTAILAIVTVTINSNWILYHQVNTQNSVDLAARSSLVRVLGDTEVEGRIDRARALGARIYNLNEDRPEQTFSPDRIQFGVIQNQNADDLGFVETLSSNELISAVQLVRPETAIESRVSLAFGGVFGAPNDVEIGAEATVSTRPVDVILCLDASRSMTRQSADGQFPPGGTTIHEPPLEGSRWFELKDTVELFLGALRDTNPNARIGLVTFGGGVDAAARGRLVSGLDDDLARLEQQLTVVISNDVANINQTLQSYSTDFPALGLGTSLYDGILDSIPAFENDSSSKHIIMLSDGEQAAVNRPSPLGAAKLAAEQGITIHTISFGGNFGTMASIASETNGTNFTALSEQQLREAFAQLLGRFRVQLID